MTLTKISTFGFKAGDRLLHKYEVVDKLGSGWEGEVYKIKELSTGIERAAKIFFLERNLKNKSATVYAQKLHKLRHCQVLIHYHNEETIFIDGQSITILISEYVEGELLSAFIDRFRSKRLPVYQALHLLYALTKGIEEIHLLNEYHGDLHCDNVIVNRYGLNFDLKLLDMYNWGKSTKANRDYDVCSLLRIFYDALGGAKTYSKLPKEVKYICCGLKQNLILKRFRTVSQLRDHLETMSLSNMVG